MPAHLLSYGIDLPERSLHDFGARERRRHPDREEDRVEASLAHARDVDVTLARPCFEVEPFVDHLLRRIGMGVEDEGAAVEIGGAVLARRKDPCEKEGDAHKPRE
ncbi:MAG TPA: hypothetical protein VJ921_04605 [Vicinamibacteria bacterium]|nr:hypothetical protein [Vicinamibacteria bacterium]